MDDFSRHIAHHGIAVLIVRQDSAEYRIIGKYGFQRFFQPGRIDRFPGERDADRVAQSAAAEVQVCAFYLSDSVAQGFLLS